MTKTYYFDMDGVLANFHKAYATNKLTALYRETMAELEPFTHNVNLVKKLIADGNNVYILTKAANKFAEMGKIDWLDKYLPEIDSEHFICIFAGEKVEYVREAGMLIDDVISNITPWKKAGYETYYLEIKGDVIKL